MARSSWATAVIAWEMFLSVCGLGFLFSCFVVCFFDEVVVDGGATPRFLIWEYLGAMSTSESRNGRDEIGHVQCAWKTYGPTDMRGFSDCVLGFQSPPLGTGSARSSTIPLPSARVLILHSLGLAW